MHDDYDPGRIAMRESRDSDENPEAIPIIIGIDITGSMGVLAEELVIRGLNETFTALLNRKPVSDPHVMAMAIGDAYCDAAPLQVTQFEADLRIFEQLRQLWLEALALARPKLSLDQLAKFGRSPERYKRLLRLSYLSPSIVATVLEGTQPARLTSRFLQNLDGLPLTWSEQEQLLLT